MVQITVKQLIEDLKRLDDAGYGDHHREKRLFYEPQ